MAKKKKMDQQLQEYRKGIDESLQRWKNINQNGCNDPFYPDGTNMNLVRNHIIYYKKLIEEICAESNIPLPEEYYIPLPPKVNQNYMANLRQKERVKRLRQYGSELVTKRIAFDSEQLSFL